MDLGLIILIFSSSKKNTSGIIPKRLCRDESLLISGLILICGMLALNALLAAPNTSDSINYHMSRVEHWIQNHNINYYPTHVLRQLFYLPWAEWAILHLQILNGNDLSANLVQWFSYLGGLIGMSLIAQELGASRIGQIFTAIIAASIPMAILQSTSTQNDLVVTFWSICFIYFLFVLQRDFRWIYLISAALSFAMGVLTKALVVIFTAPFFVTFLFFLLKKNKTQMVTTILVIAVTGIILLFPFLNLNRKAGWSLLSGPPQLESVIVQKVSFRGFLVSFVRNICLHFGTSNEKFNRYAENTVLSFHKTLNFPIEDENIFWGGSRFHLQGQPFHEDHAGNPLHALLLLPCSLLLFINKKIRGDRALIQYYLQVSAAFLLLCLVFKWQPWSSRFHTGVFFLYAPFIALTLVQLCPRKIITAVAFLIMISSLPWILLNESRPLIGKTSVLTNNRSHSYFGNHPAIEESVSSAVKALKHLNCSDIGLEAHEGAFEYPFWPLLKQPFPNGFRFEHVNVNNSSGSFPYPLKEFDPCAIISLKQNLPRVQLDYKNSKFVRTHHFYDADIFAKDATGRLRK